MSELAEEIELMDRILKSETREDLQAARIAVDLWRAKNGITKKPTVVN